MDYLKLHQRGSAFARHGMWSLACIFLEPALHLCIQKHGDAFIDTYRLQHDLGMVYMMMRRKWDAYPLLRDAVAAWRADQLSVPEEHQQYDERMQHVIKLVDELRAKYESSA